MLRILAFVLIILCALSASQLPEFSQQYRQRLGGAVGELGAVVSRLDEDAAAEGLSRLQALRTYDESGEPFLMRRGLSIREALARFERLNAQLLRLESAGPLMRPFEVLRSPDARIARGALEAYEPAVPVTFDGAVYALIGALGGALLALLPLPLRRRRRRLRHA